MSCFVHDPPTLRIDELAAPAGGTYGSILATYWPAWVVMPSGYNRGSSIFSSSTEDVPKSKKSSRLQLTFGAGDSWPSIWATLELVSERGMNFSMTVVLGGSSTLSKPKLRPKPRLSLQEGGNKISIVPAGSVNNRPVSTPPQ